MFDEKNIYVRQAEVKGCIKQSANGIFLLSDLTVNSTLKNYKKVLSEAFTITINEINTRNQLYDKQKKTTVKEIKTKSKKPVEKKETTSSTKTTMRM